MILLFGGTSDAAPIAQVLANEGKSILVCTATNEPMNIGKSKHISRHCGRLTAEEMVDLINAKSVELIIDTTHPYAVDVSKQIQLAAEKSGQKVLTYYRPASILKSEKLHIVKDHITAAKLAFSFKKPVLLTTGANNLHPYCQEAKRTTIQMTARVLNREESLQNCYNAGLKQTQIIAEKGPFSVKENRAHIQIANAGVMVIKDSGTRGGIESRLEAAKLEKCEIVMIERPTPVGDNIYTDYQSLINQVLS